MKNLKRFNNFINERLETKLNYREFITEVEKRVVDIDKDGNTRDEEGRLYWYRSVNRDIDGHKSYLTSPMNLLYRAYTSGLYELDDISEQSLGRAAETLGNNEVEEGHGFGSSDWTYLLKEFLESDGIKVGFINGRLKRLTDDQADILDVERSIKHIINFGLGGYENFHKARMRGLGDALVDKGLAVKTGNVGGLNDKESNEYSLTEEGEKLSKLELAEIAINKKL